MTDKPLGKKPGWKQGGPDQKKAAEPVRDWKKEKGAVGAPTGATRKIKVLASVTVLFALLGLVVWLLYFLFLPKKTALILVVAGYETNLTLPQNAPGRAGIDALRNLASSDNKNFENRGADGDLRDKAAWEPPETLQKVAEKTDVLLIVFSVHGVSEGTENYLLRDGGSPWNLKEHLSLNDVLTSLAAVDPKKPKVLVLDVVHTGSNWSTGMIHNQFVANLKAMNERIKGIPNLVVLCSTDEHQRSWHSPEWGRSVYLHYLLEGLKGAADTDKNDWINLQELHAFVASRTQRWVYDNRLELQTPIMLPNEANDASWVTKMRVVQQTKHKEPDQMPAAPFTAPPGLSEVWAQWMELRDQAPPPWVYAPHLWKLYSQAVVRHEELLLVGSSKASDARMKADDCYKALKDLRELPLESANYTLPLAAVGGRHMPRDKRDQVRAWVSRLNADASEKVLAEIQQTAAVDLTLIRQELHRFLLRTEVRELADLRDTSKVSRILNRLEPNKAVRPTEVHFARMVGLPLQFSDEDYASNRILIKDALTARLDAEEIALSFDAATREHPYAEHILPWLAGRLVKADESRRYSEDYLFAHKWDLAQRTADEMRTAYKKIKEDGAKLRHALRVRDEVMAVLPSLSHYLAVLEPSDATKTRDQIAQVRKIWEDLHDLDEELTKAPSENEALLDKQITDMDTLAKRVKAEYGKLTEDYRAHFNKLVNESALPPNLHALYALATVPLLDQKDRVRLTERIRYISLTLLQKTENSETTEDKIKASPEKSKAEVRSQERVARHGGLLLSMAGKYHMMGKYDGYTQLRVATPNVFAVAVQAGPDIREVWKRLAADMHLHLKGLVNKNLAEARPELWKMEKMGRHLSVASAAEFFKSEANPGALARNLRLYDLLFWMAQRTQQDFWNWDYKAEIPYYVDASRSFLRDAHAMLGRLPEAEEPAFKAERRADVTKVEAKLDRNRPRPVLEGLPGVAKAGDKPFLYITSELEYELDIHLKVEGVPRGIPYATFVIEKPDLLTQDEREKRRFAELIKDRDSVPFTMKLYNELLKRQHDEFRRKKTHAEPKPGETARRDTSIRLYSWFRGHVNEPVINVALYPFANNVNADEPALGNSALTLYGKGVRASDSALVIVLDCSGSMKETDGKGRPRFERVKDALGVLLANLDEDIQVSLWIYGQKKTQDAVENQNEGSIHKLHFARRWKKEMVGEVMGKVKTIEPEWFTPVVRSIIEAKADLADWESGKQKGFATLIVLTDGEDTCFNISPNNKSRQAPDPQLNPGNRLSIEQFLTRELANSKIKYSVVAYEITGNARNVAENQFGGVVRSLGEDRFSLDFVNDVEDLKSMLKKRSQRKLEYRIKNESETQVLFAGVLPDSRAVQPIALEPGNYTVEVQKPTGGVVTQRIKLDKGDWLTLRLEPAGNNFRLVRDPITREFTENQLVMQRQQTGEKWTVTQVRNSSQPGSARQSVLVLLEQTEAPPVSSQDTVTVLGPSFVWMEIQHAASKNKPQRLQWGRSPDRPAPAWTLDASWNSDPEVQNEATLQIWLSASPPDPVPGSIERETHWNLGGIGANVQRPKEANTILGGKVRLESVRVETHPVRFGAEGTVEFRECLVVRAAYDPGVPIFFEPQLGLEKVAAVHHYYTDAGKYTGYYPLSRSRAEKLQQLKLYSIDAFKQEVQKKGLHGSLVLPKPQPNAEAPGNLDRRKSDGGPGS
jgi:hypothetical protein